MSLRSSPLGHRAARIGRALVAVLLCTLTVLGASSCAAVSDDAERTDRRPTRTPLPEADAVRSAALAVLRKLQASGVAGPRDTPDQPWIEACKVAQRKGMRFVYDLEVHYPPDPGGAVDALVTVLEQAGYGRLRPWSARDGDPRLGTEYGVIATRANRPRVTIGASDLSLQVSVESSCGEAPPYDCPLGELPDGVDPDFCVPDDWPEHLNSTFPTPTPHPTLREPKSRKTTPTPSSTGAPKPTRIPSRVPMPTPLPRETAASAVRLGSVSESALQTRISDGSRTSRGDSSADE